MLAKLCVLILCVGITAAVLLHLRQSRLQVVHELARVQMRMNERDRDLFRIRTQIAQRITPEQVEQMAMQFGPLTPIGVDLAEDAKNPAHHPPETRTTSHKPGAARPPSGAHASVPPRE